MVNITGWGAFWLMVGGIGTASIIMDAIGKMVNVRQIVKMLERAIEAGEKMDPDKIKELLEWMKFNY